MNVSLSLSKGKSARKKTIAVSAAKLLQINSESEVLGHGVNPKSLKTLKHPELGVYEYFGVQFPLYADIIYIYISGWWFVTFLIFPYIGKNHPTRLIFLRGVETTNQVYSIDYTNIT